MNQFTELIISKLVLIKIILIGEKVCTVNSVYLNYQNPF